MLLMFYRLYSVKKKKVKKSSEPISPGCDGDKGNLSPVRESSI